MKILEQAGFYLADNLDKGRLVIWNSTKIPGLKAYQHKLFADNRGAFYDLRIPEVDIPDLVVRQWNVSENFPNVVRGMHGEPMPKLVRAMSGQAIGAWVDARIGPTFGNIVRVTEMRPVDCRITFAVPPGVLNGFAALEDTLYGYLVNKTYPELQRLDPSTMTAVSCTKPFPGYPDGLFHELKNPIIISKRDGEDAISWDQFVLQVRATRNEQR